MIKFIKRTKVDLCHVGGKTMKKLIVYFKIYFRKKNCKHDNLKKRYYVHGNSNKIKKIDYICEWCGKQMHITGDLIDESIEDHLK